MPVFFTGGAVGRTIGCKDENTQGTMQFVSFGDKSAYGISWSRQKSIITRITLGYQGNYQFLHTIGNDVYIYVFGDRIGQVTISGLSAASDCDKPGDPKHGFELIMEWYRDNRVASRKAPIALSIGQTAIEGFVVGLNGDAVDPMTRLVQYGLQMVTLPEKSSKYKTPGGKGDNSGAKPGYVNSSQNQPNPAYGGEGNLPNSGATGPTEPRSDRQVLQDKFNAAYSSWQNMTGAASDVRADNAATAAAGDNFVPTPSG